MRRSLAPNSFPRRTGNQIENIAALPRAIAACAISVYRAVISPAIHVMNGPACRFEPSCSEYAREAIAEYGVVRGGAMAMWRIARCNPIGGHGYDPVPARSVRRSGRMKNPRVTAANGQRTRN